MRTPHNHSDIGQEAASYRSRNTNDATRQQDTRVLAAESVNVCGRLYSSWFRNRRRKRTAMRTPHNHSDTSQEVAGRRSRNTNDATRQQDSRVLAAESVNVCGRLYSSWVRLRRGGGQQYGQPANIYDISQEAAGCRNRNTNDATRQQAARVLAAESVNVRGWRRNGYFNLYRSAASLQFCRWQNCIKNLYPDGVSLASAVRQLE